MPRPYSDELRERVIEAVEAGGVAEGSRRELQSVPEFRGEMAAALA